MMKRFGSMATGILAAMALTLAPVMLAGGVLTSGTALAEAQKQAGQQTGQQQPTDITADNLEILDEKNLIIFTGNVRASRGDTRLRADRLEVYTEKASGKDGAQGNGGEGGTKMRRWVATGNVRIIKGDMTITGNRADMDVPRDVVTVTGNVVVRQRGSTIRGAKLVANLKTNVTRIIAGKKRRVHGVFR